LNGSAILWITEGKDGKAAKQQDEQEMHKNTTVIKLRIQQQINLYAF